MGKIVSQSHCVIVSKISLGGLHSPRRTPREKSRRWQFWRSPDQSLIWDCHWYSTGRSWYKRISGKPLSRNLQTIPVKINHRLLLGIFYILENDKSARTKCFLDLTLDIWSKKNSPTRKPRNRQPKLIKTKTFNSSSPIDARKAITATTLENWHAESTL